MTALSCIALNVYFEARSDNMSGQYAVAHVVLNRVQDNRWPNDVCNVVTQRNDNNVCQFSWWRRMYYVAKSLTLLVVQPTIMRTMSIPIGLTICYTKETLALIISSEKLMG
jgi:hypothetical protein